MPDPTPGWDCPTCRLMTEGDYCGRRGSDRHGATPPPDSPDWVAVAHADHEYFRFICEIGGPDIASIEFPRFHHERTFQLRGVKMLIGRHSVSRGINPEIDLTGPPEDAAVGRSHALLLRQAGGTWSVVDLKSTNGTYVNDFRSPPLKPHEETPLSHEDRLYLGAWTRLTIRLDDEGRARPVY